MNINTALGQLRILAIVEGISYLSFALTMPLKYAMNLPTPNAIVGRLHGALFIAYIIWVLLNAKKQKWNLFTTLMLLFASLIPFMTFWADKKYLKAKIN